MIEGLAADARASSPEWWGKLLDQLLALIAFFAFPTLQYLLLKYRSRNEGDIELWYLPAFGFRVVIRNLPRKRTLSDIKYRVILRKIVPASPGASVATLVDTPLHEQEDFFLFPGTDQTLFSFRIGGNRKEELALVVTDKLGVEQRSVPVSEFDRIICDYGATLNNLFNFNIRLAKRAEINSSTLGSLWEQVRANNEENSFPIDRVRNVG
jgi:hypothetical protein